MEGDEEWDSCLALPLSGESGWNLEDSDDEEEEHQQARPRPEGTAIPRLRHEDLFARTHNEVRIKFFALCGAVLRAIVVGILSI
jgi:hypothetical protein